jgi:hypothetical protein
VKTAMKPSLTQVLIHAELSGPSRILPIRHRRLNRTNDRGRAS